MIRSNYFKRKYQMGGPPRYSGDYEAIAPTPSTSINEQVGTNTSQIRGGGLGKFTNYLPLVTNIANAFQTLPRPNQPYFETNINPDLVDYSADRARLERDLLGANSGLSSVNPQVANAIRVSNLGKYLDSKAGITQNERNTNAEIRNRAKFYNQQVNARNTERKNSFNDLLLNRSVNQQRLRAENFSDAINKLQLARRDKDMLDLENRRLDIIEKTYGKDSGWFNRNLYESLNDERESLRPRKLGGYLKKY